MACLAPQFRWAPSPSAHAHHHPSPPSSSSRSSGLRVRCAVTSAAVFDAGRTNGCFGETLEHAYAAPDSASALKRNVQSNFASEALLNEEAVVAAAAAEAVAFARAAAEAAQEVVCIARKNNDQKPVIRQKKAVDNYLVNEILRTVMESTSLNEYASDVLLENLETYGVKGDEGELDDNAQHTENIAVKSARQSERRARRTRAAIKATSVLASQKAIKADTSVFASQKTRTSSTKKWSKGSSSSMDPLASLWKVSGRRLLKAHEEVEFSNSVQDLLKLLAIQAELTEYNGGEPSFTEWARAAGTDEKTLRKRLHCGIYCKNRMITSNVRLVISIAREYEGLRMDLPDLIQEGMCGLIRAVEKFDASRGFRFSTYSYWWIKQAIKKFVAGRPHVFRLPSHMVEASYRVKECTQRLRRKLERRPTAKEIANDTGLPVKRVEAAIRLPKYSVSLESKVPGTDLTYEEVITDPNDGLSEDMDKKAMKEDVHQALDAILTTREKQVVVLRFGLDVGRARTLQEVGDIMGVSRERIRQIESVAFRKLRSSERVMDLEVYLMSEPDDF